MEPLWIIAIIGLIVWLFTIPARRYEKRTGKKLGRGGAASAMHTMNEIFQPSAANAAVIVEEQREARIATPTPEGKPLGEGND